MDQGAATIPPPGRNGARRARPAAALGAVGLGVAALLGGAWIVRVPVADTLLRSALAERGAAGAYQIERLDLAGATLANVRIGPAARPDFEAQRVTVTLAWRLGPRLSGVAVEGGRLRAAWATAGLDLGDVGKLTRAEPAARRQPLPDIAITAPGFMAELASPFGPIVARIDAAGRLTRDFAATAAISPTSVLGAGGRIDGLSATATARTVDRGLAFQLAGDLDGLESPTARTAGARLELTGRVDRALTTAEARGALSIAQAVQAGATLSGLSSTVTVMASDLGPGLRPASWRADLRTEARRASNSGADLEGLSARIDLAGDATSAKGGWRLGAKHAAAAGLTAPLVAAGELAVRDGRLSGAGAVQARGARAVDPRAMAGLVDVLGATPAGPAASASKPALARALAAFDVDAPIAFAWAEGAGAVRGTGPVTARAATGALLALSAPADAPPWQVTLPGPGVGVAGTLSLTGGGLPDIALRRIAVDIAKGDAKAAGQLSIAGWQGGGASLQAEDLDLGWRGDARDGRLTVAGELRMTGPFAGMALRDAVVPLDLDVLVRGGAWRVTPRTSCLPVAAVALDAVGLSFANPRFEVCAGRDGAIATGTAAGALGGGFGISPTTLRGALTGERPAAASVAVDGATVAFAGTTARPRLRLDLSALRYTQAMAPDRTMTATAATVTANVLAGESWRIDGGFTGAAVDDPGLPVTVASGAGTLAVEPVAEGAIVRLGAVTARVTDKAERPAFNPVRIADATAVIAEGVVRSEGDVRLESTGAALGRFTATHDIARNEGEAVMRAADLRFTESLQPFQISELARGVVENVEGPIDLTGRLQWSGDVVKSDGLVAFKSISAATAGLGPVSGVVGAIAFDDLALMTTPPGQEIRLGEINPGVAVRDGTVRFQLKRDGVIALESAQFPFARGKLSVQPALVTIGAAETRYALELTDVDVAQLIRDLDFKDLTATGRVQGVFPLIVTPTGARIENGLLTAAPGGGEIAYTGQAAQSVSSGPGQVAFDALRSFRYDNLALELNGDLDGEIVTGIRFQGVNNAPLTAARLVPGLRTMGATGLPFRFNVTVRAPFKDLAEGANRVINPLKAIDAARGPQGVDPSKVP